MAGQAAPQQELLDRLVEGDFDPEEYDRQMAAAFGDDYYAAVGGLHGGCCMWPARHGSGLQPSGVQPVRPLARPPAWPAGPATATAKPAPFAHLWMLVATVCRRVRRRRTNWRTSCLRR